MRSTILCVDDEKVLLNVLAEQLETWFGANYNIEKALSGAEALEIIDDCLEHDMKVSVVISDYIMPVMKGDELLEKINERDSRIKKIMLTGYSSIEGIIHAINKAGLYRFISKPWDNKDLMLTLLEAIKAYEREQMTADLAKKYELLNSKYKALIEGVEESVNSVVDILAKAADKRGIDAEGHSKRVAQYSGFIAKAVKMSNNNIKKLLQAALMHDVGKIALSDDDLKELRTCREDFTTNSAIRRVQIKTSEILLHDFINYEDVIDGIKYQFEEYAGSGPLGTVGRDIPLNARIIAIANDFDYLKNKSEKKFGVDDIVRILEGNKGVVYDPELVDVFISILKPTIG